MTAPIYITHLSPLPPIYLFYPRNVGWLIPSYFALPISRYYFLASLSRMARHACIYCGARFWSEERVHGVGTLALPVYNTCCKGGRILLPSYKPPPEPLLSLLTGVDHTLSTHFYDNIRQYNSMFAITSMGVNVISSINDGRDPYVFKISGQLCHWIGSLVPQSNAKPEYC
jgi:hypothetical protein